jgi:hypothetical protein
MGSGLRAGGTTGYDGAKEVGFEGPESLQTTDASRSKTESTTGG